MSLKDKDIGKQQEVCCLIISWTKHCNICIYWWSLKMIKDLGLLIFDVFFLDLAFLRELLQSVWHCIYFSMSIIYIKGILIVLFGLLYLLKAKTLGIYKLLDVIYIWWE